MKAHIGVDAVTGLTHSVVATSANVADVTLAGALVREDDKRVYGDAVYTGMGKHLDEEKDASDSRCCVAAKRGAIKKMDESPMKTRLLAIEKAKASIRFMSSRTSFATGRCATRGWPSTRRNFSACSDWPTLCWRHDAKAKLMGPVRLESALAAG